MWEILKGSNMQVFGIPEGKEKENVTEQCLKDNSQGFSKVAKDIKQHNQKAQNTSKQVHRHIKKKIIHQN